MSADSDLFAPIERAGAQDIEVGQMVCERARDHSHLMVVMRIDGDLATTQWGIVTNGHLTVYEGEYRLDELEPAPLI